MSEQGNGDTSLTPMKKTQRPAMDPSFFPIPWYILDEPSPGPVRMKPKQLAGGDPLTPVTPMRSKQNNELHLESNKQAASEYPTTPLPSRKHGSPAADVTPPGAPNKSRRLSSTLPDGTPIKNIDDDDDDESSGHDGIDNDDRGSVSSPGLFPSLADIPDDHEPSDEALANAPAGYLLEWDFLYPSQREWAMRHQLGGSLSDAHADANGPFSGVRDDTADDADNEDGDSDSSDSGSDEHSSGSANGEPLPKLPSPWSIKSCCLLKLEWASA